MSLETESITAVTADFAMKRQLEIDPYIKLRSEDSIVVGNWMDDSFCDAIGSHYDTILSDYLIGAVDGFSPYAQDIVLQRF